MNLLTGENRRIPFGVANPKIFRIFGLGLVSAGITAYQLTLMQLLSLAQWYHFAYMLISLALLGFGASGGVLMLVRKRAMARPDQFAGWAMLGCAVAMPGAVFLASRGVLAFDTYLLFVDESQVWRLGLVSAILWVPFFLGAFSIGVILTAEAERAGAYYCASMFGSGIGGIGGLVALSEVLPQHLPVVCAALPLIGGWMICRPGTRLVVRLAWLSPLILLFLFLLRPVLFEASQFKDLSRILDMPGARILDKQPDTHGTVHIVDAPMLHSAPGLSLHETGPVPQGDAMFVNGDFRGVLMPVPSAEGQVWEQGTTASLGFWISPKPKGVLLLGSEGGSHLRRAYAFAAGDITVVEDNAVVAEILERQFFEGPGSLAGRVEHLSPRVYLERSGTAFDLIQFPTQGQFHGGVGMHSLGAEFLLTLEAFSKAWNLLEYRGVLTVTAWMDYPERKPLRLLATLVQVLREAGVANPDEHLAAIRSWGAVTIAASRQPIASEAAERVREQAMRWGFDILALPGVTPEERRRFHEIESDTIFEVTDALLRADAGVVDSYPFNLRPASDDRPFFSQFLRWHRLRSVLDGFGRHTLPFFEMGTFILGVTLALLAALSVIFVLPPLVAVASSSSGSASTFAYFACIGLGFMFVEMVALQAFHLLWGNPVVAAGWVIGGMLLFSGVGSVLSQRITPNAGRVRKVALASGAILLMFSWLLFPITRELTSSAPWVRYPLSLALLAVVAIPLGMPFPLAWRLLKSNRPEQLPWAWAVNGCFSVMGPPLATLFSVSFGFTAVLVAAASIYALSAVVPLTRISPRYAG